MRTRCDAVVRPRSAPRVGAVLVPALLLLLALPVAPAADACAAGSGAACATDPLPPTGACRAEAAGVPCGYVYPLIRLDLDSAAAPWPLAAGSELEIPVRMVFSFDAGNEGLGPEEPGRPIVVTFEYPRKPRWVEIVAEPENVPVPIQPQYLRPDASDPNDVRLMYVYEADVTFRFRVVDTPVLRQGAEFARLLVFARSTESGLYKPAYGIREVRVAPEGAVYEAADVARNAPDPPATPLLEQRASLGPSEVRLVPTGDRLQLWSPAPFVAALDPPQPATLSLSLVDETARVLYTTGPRLTRDGVLAVNLTFAEPGLHHVLVSAQPVPNAPDAFAPQTVAFPLRVQGGGAYRMPQEYRAFYTEAVSEFRGDAGDPAAQFEKFIPLPIYEGASSGSLAVVLRTGGALRADGGVGNVNVQVLDPNGAVVAQGVVDAFNPVKSIPLSGFPGTGLFQLRVFGAALNPLGAQGATVDLLVSVGYDGRPIVETEADGRLDPAGTASYGRLAATLGATAHPVWSPVRLAPDLAFAGSPARGAWHVASVFAEDGLRAVSTPRLADGSALVADVAFPSVGRHLVVFDVWSADQDWQASPLVFVVEAGAPRADVHEYPATLRVEGSARAEAGSLGERPVAVFAVRVLDGATSAVAEAAGATLRARPATGGDVAASARDRLDLAALGAGDWLVEVLAERPLGGDVAFGAAVEYPGPVRVANPDASAPPGASGGRFVPATGVLTAVAAALAVGLARVRTKR